MKQILPTIFDFELVANSPKEDRYELSGPNSAYSYGIIPISSTREAKCES